MKLKNVKENQEVLLKITIDGKAQKYKCKVIRHAQTTNGVLLSGGFLFGKGCWLNGDFDCLPLKIKTELENEKK